MKVGGGGSGDTEGGMLCSSSQEAASLQVREGVRVGEVGGGQRKRGMWVGTTWGNSMRFGQSLWHAN